MKKRKLNRELFLFSAKISAAEFSDFSLGLPHAVEYIYATLPFLDRQIYVWFWNLRGDYKTKIFHEEPFGLDRAEPPRYLLTPSVKEKPTDGSAATRYVFPSVLA